MSLNTKILELLFKVRGDQASRELSGLQRQVKGLGATFSEVGKSAMLAGGVLAGIGTAVASQIDVFQDYALETANLRDMLNMTTEEASFLMSAMERYEITQDTMVAVFRTMNRDGLEPTVDNLGALLREYDNITDATEKTQYAQEMLGEQGLKQIIPWWEQLTEAQKENFGNQEDGIVINDEAIDASRNLKEAQEDLKAVWATLWGEIAVDVIPQVVEALEGVLEKLETLQQFDDFTILEEALIKLSEPLQKPFKDLYEWLEEHTLIKNILYGITPDLSNFGIQMSERIYPDTFVPGNAPDYQFSPEGESLIPGGGGAGTFDAREAGEIIAEQIVDAMERSSIGQ